MQETLKHREAFDYYYSLKDKRSLLQVARKMGVSTTSVGRWSGAHGWQNQIAKRDAKVGTAISEKVDKQIVKQSVDHRIGIQKTMDTIQGSIDIATNALGDVDKRKKMGVPTFKDISTLATAQQGLVRLDLLLAGEADSREEHVFKFEKVYPDDKPKRVESEVIDG